MKRLAKGLFDLFSSYGLAVAVLAGMFVLTFLGTLEQQRSGLYDVQKTYFESFVAWHPTRFGELPLPGGVLLMGLLAVNLALGGLVRIRKSTRTAGIIVGHIGIAVLMLAGLVKLTLGEDGYLALIEGESSDEFSSFFLWEVALFDATAEADVEELLIGDAELRALQGGGARVFTHPELPFDLELASFVPNARVLPVGPMWEPEYPVVDGYAVWPLAKEQEAEANVPAVYARALAGDEVVAEGILFGLERHPLVVAAGDELVAVSLRKKRYGMPFTVRLDDFYKEEHPRTDIPAVYRSDIAVIVEEEDGSVHEDKVRIEMNRPLRDGGLVLFQSSFGERMTDRGPRTFSQFAVVRNPSDHWPIAACAIIGVGLLLTFTQRLLGTIRKQNAARAAR